MDLVAGVRKEGSRGGRDFKWSDVRESTHRENYLGHSLMAPVGRWQKGRDLSWYAKADEDDAEGEERQQQQQREAVDSRAEEIRMIKEAEQEALAKALGFAPTPRSVGAGTGANSTPVSGKEVERAVKETVGGEDGEKGVGFGGFGGRDVKGNQSEVLEGSGMTKPRTRRGGRSRERRRRSRSRDRYQGREKRYGHDRDRGERRRRSRSRHRDREKDRRRRSRSRSRYRRRYERDDRESRRRSYSPYERQSRRYREEYRERRR